MIKHSSNFHPLLAALLLIFAGWTEARIKPTDGLWVTYDDPEVGSGLVLMTQGNTTVITIFTYDDGGHPVWYLATGTVDETGLLETTLLQTTEGTYLMADQPTPARLSDQTQSLELKFQGNNEARFVIEGTSERIIRPMNFGFDTVAGFPDLSGQWVVADVHGGEPLWLDLQALPTSTTPITPFLYFAYESKHPDSAGWILDCYVLLVVQVDFQCNLGDPSGSDLWSMTDLDLSSQQMVLRPAGQTADTRQAFRLDSDQRLLPNDGFWRTQDDPSLGSGVVLHTQGEQSVVVVYSYTDSGSPIWQIASGQFNPQGLLSTQLYTTSGGTPISQADPTSATINETTQDISIQLLGTELAEIIIDGSPPKFLQNMNHNMPLFATEHFHLNDQPYQFPMQSGEWVMVDAGRQLSARVNMHEFSDSVSPIPLTAPLIYDNQLDDGNPYDLLLSCHRIIADNEIIGYCTGLGAFQDQIVADQLRTYFQDIGHNRFRLYYGTEQNDINRSSPYYDFYRLTDFN